MVMGRTNGRQDKEENGCVPFGTAPSMPSGVVPSTHSSVIVWASRSLDVAPMTGESGDGDNPSDVQSDVMSRGEEHGRKVSSSARSSSRRDEEVAMKSIRASAKEKNDQESQRIVKLQDRGFCFF